MTAQHPRMFPSFAQRRAAFVAAALVTAALGASGEARAAGLYFADRGVRPLARGGAFIAGGDDLGAIAYNPAGIYEAGAQVLIDGSWLHFTSEYTRQSLLRQVDPNTGQTTATFRQTHPTVHGTTPIMPIPTLALSFKPHDDWVVAVGAWAPYAAISSYPDTVQGRPAPQRYSLLNMDGSALAFVGAAAAWAPSKEWRLGIGLGALVGSFKSTVVFSGCVPERFFCAPEDPDWDVLAELDAGPIVAPSGELGAIWIPMDELRIGASVQLPVYVRSSATIRTRQPAAAVFERATQEGETADVAFDLPWNLRLGVEFRLIEDLRVELGFGYERWSMHDAISIKPRDIRLNDVAGFPKSYKLPEVPLARNFQDSVSVRMGGEYAFDALGYTWEGRAGISYETSAVPPPYLSVLTIDSSKVTTAVGIGLHIGDFRLDATYAHIFVDDVTVDPADARIPQVSPVQANPPRNPNYINAGHYASRGDVFGLGLAYSFDGPSRPGIRAPKVHGPEAPVPAAPPPAGEEEAGPEDEEEEETGRRRAPVRRASPSIWVKRG